MGNLRCIASVLRSGAIPTTRWAHWRASRLGVAEDYVEPFQKLGGAVLVLRKVIGKMGDLNIFLAVRWISTIDSVCLGL
jgi:hypothetical protein